MADKEFNNNDQDKTEEPSLNRIEEFRKRGDVASSKELSSVLVLSASILSLILGSLYIYETMGEFVEWLYLLDVEKAFEPEQFKKLISRAIVVG